MATKNYTLISEHLDQTLKRFRGLQFILLLVILISLFFRVYPLEMQRQIINVAINLKMIDKLYLYCGLYMGAVLIAGLLKYLTNTMQAVLGQKILIGMRQEIYQHILQLPLPFFHRTQTGTIISSVTAFTLEVSPINFWPNI